MFDQMISILPWKIVEQEHSKNQKGRRRLMEWSPLYTIILLLSSSSHLRFCASKNSLAPGESISLNQTLVSNGGDFVLGFFPLGSGTSTRLYVGIWYNIPRRTVVWVANRESPIVDSSGVLRISNDNNLVVVDSKGSVFWSSNVTGTTISSENSSTAVLQSSGNLVLKQGEDVLWQSFDHPSDTFLPGMRLYLFKNTTPPLTSWKDSEDPSPGNFSVGVDLNTYHQLFIWRGREPLWRSSVWSGNPILASRGPENRYLWDGAIVGNYVTFSLSNSSDYLRFTLLQTGLLELLDWDESSNKWSVLGRLPSMLCDTYNSCGPNAYCNANESVPKCMCFQGFEPVIQSDWSNGNFSRGCARRKALSCGHGDGFLRIGAMKLPDQFQYLTNISSSECEAKCRDNCSCTAYAYSNISLGSIGVSNILRCLIWFEELIDAEQLTNGGEDLYLHLVASELGSKSNMSKTWITLIIVSVCVCVVVLLVTCVYVLWKCRVGVKGFWKKKKNKEKSAYDLTSSIDLPKGFSVSNEFGESPELPLFDFDCIAAATEGFSDSCKLGQGGFGKVYKGMLPEGSEIAVKRLSTNSEQGLKEFMNEVMLIAKLQHRNLVRLLGCCIQGEEKILIYEYMCNKSLDFFLLDPTRLALLDWGKRFNIIKGIARGLHYLHHDSRLRIIHRDIKASNILLDREMNPKVADFGMARIIGGNQNQANTIRVVGTYGYMAPEYAMEGLFSLKSDVYSFGVIVLETVSGLRNSSFHHPIDFSNLLTYAWNLWNEGNGMDFTDPSVAQSCSRNEVLRCIHVGLLCLQDRPNDCPTMSSVVLMLGNESAEYPTPKQPTFTSERNVPEDVRSTTVSVNNVTVTMEEGR